MNHVKILIVEDDMDINNLLVELLTGQEYEAVSAYSGTEALLWLEKQNFDLVLLDLMLPGMPGEDVLEKIKKDYPDTCVIAVSAKDDIESKIHMLRGGADDYITKPFDTEELLARVEVALRKNNKADAKQEDIYCLRDLKLDVNNILVTLKDEPVSLTKREYLILKLLMSHPNRVYTKNNIFEAVWEEEFVGEDNAVNVHISNIRQKLAKIDPEDTYIQTVWGIGFKMKV
ncbi:MAG: response regulator transcription factor [Lachnospiraceae bacterium]|nr:response regulator transcription factor [Lachnospiraceae bacterium]